ncbi:hypothetical protein DPMN_011941 [Dreissena polymorpha]|uniref:Uncharacterized protein n=1 Tax=Dreissena polymorpha TaxID=45954 RepID=A0A9D4N621_DREPO|nr:hypothetical protein DPMN_011941 [Dreissena polymorpha]
MSITGFVIIIVIIIVIISNSPSAYVKGHYNAQLLNCTPIVYTVMVDCRSV